MTDAARIGRVMVGVDFDEPSASAVAVAGAVAEAAGAELALVHAASIEMPPYFTEAQQRPLEAEQRAMRARIAEEVRALAAARTGVPFTVAVDEGPPAGTLLRHASGGDLLVVGTHGYRGPQRWWLGSVAEEVVRHAVVPVLVVPVQADPPALRRGGTLVTQRDAGTAEPWVAAFEGILAMTVVRTETIGGCGVERLQTADLVIVPPAVHPSEFRAIVDVLKACAHPVLFVPAREASAQGGSVRTRPIERRLV